MKANWLRIIPLLGCIALSTVATAQDDARTELWGGRDIALRQTASGATIDFDCGHGNITQPISPDATGAFAAAGTYSPEMGGPTRKDSPPRDLPATYKGTIQGDTMHLEVLLQDKTLQLPAFTLTRGNSGRLMRCR